MRSHVTRILLGFSVVLLGALGVGCEKASSPLTPQTPETTRIAPRPPQISNPGVVARLPAPYPLPPDLVLKKAFEDLLSGDPVRATNGLAVILDVDPYLYGTVLTYLGQNGDPEGQQFIQDLIAAWLAEHSKIEPAPVEGDGGKYATFEIEGSVEIKPGGSLEITTPIKDFDFDLPNETIPFDSGEIGDQGGSTVSTTTLSVNNASIPIDVSFPIPTAYTPGVSVGVDMETCVSLTITIRRKCKEE